MKRREVIAGLGVLAATWPLTSSGQQTALPIVGFLSGRSRHETETVLAELHRGLAEFGFVEGKNLAGEYRWAEGHYERLPALATDLVERQVTVIAATGGNLAGLAAATSTIPIVFAAGGDPVKTGLVASRNHPGANVTGIALLIAELGAKRLEVLRELVPQAARIAVLVNPSYPTATAEAREAIARASVLEVEVLNAPSEKDLETAFAAVAARKIEGLIVANDPFLIDLRDRLVRMAAERAVPTVYYTRDFVEAGGLVSYGASIADGYHKVGLYVGQILKGARPADLPVQQPTKFELVINLKAAKTLGLIIPPSLLARADEVIE